MKILINLGGAGPGKATDSHNVACGLRIARCVGGAGAEEQRRSKS